MKKREYAVTGESGEDFDIALTSEEMSMLGVAVHKQGRARDLVVDSVLDRAKGLALMENRRMRVRLYYVVVSRSGSEGLTRVTSDRAGRERLEGWLSGSEVVSGLDMMDVTVGSMGELDDVRALRYGVGRGEELYEVTYTYEMDVSVVGDALREYERELGRYLMGWMVDEGAVAVFDWVIVGQMS